MEKRKVKKYKITQSVLLGIGMVNEFIRREFGPYINLNYLDIEEIKYPEKEECVINFKTYLSHPGGGATLSFVCHLEKHEKNEWTPKTCTMYHSGNKSDKGEKLIFWQLGSRPAVYNARCG
jgi:hypothetical protein